MADSTTEASDFQGTYSHSAQAAPRQLSSGDFKDLAARADAANGTLDAVRADCPFIRVQIRVTGAVDCQLCWAASDAGDADFSHWLTIPSAIIGHGLFDGDQAAIDPTVFDNASTAHKRYTFLADDSGKLGASNVDAFVYA